MDVLVVGAGISGIGTAIHLGRDHPERSIAVLERRERIGGTWDLFRYPGVRSDSDMTSFGYRFKPWSSTKVLADGPSIRAYLAETAAEHGVGELVTFGVRVTRAAWSSAEQRWTVEATHEATGEQRTWTTGFLVNCTGYYDFDEGHRPTFPGEADFTGTIVHPQHWPEGLSYAERRVVVIGSGATAVTLVPAMADEAAHVTMLQRSPSYVFPLPDHEAMGPFLERFIGEMGAYRVVRTRNILIQRAMYLLSQRFPRAARRFYLRLMERQLGDTVDMRHFTPAYDPWEQRLCAAPDGDLFRVLREGSASVVTDEIATFTRGGIRLASGEHLDADLVVTATGLKLQALGGMTLEVDGEVVDPASRMAYRSVLMEGVPNFSWVFGYTNAPWTLKADLAGRYVERLLDHMAANGHAVVVPVDDGDHRTDGHVMDALSSGYVRRSAHLLPRQGRDGVWRVEHHYGHDKKALLRDPIPDPALRFTPSRRVVAAA